MASNRPDYEASQAQEVEFHCFCAGADGGNSNSGYTVKDGRRIAHRSQALLNQTLTNSGMTRSEVSSTDYRICPTDTS